MNSCSSCSKNIVNLADLALGNSEGNFCRHCVDDLGELKSYEEVFANQVGFLIAAENISQEEAERRTKEQLAKTPIWKNHE